MAANNTSYTAAAGQVFLGQKVEPAPTVFGQRVTTAGGICAGGNVPSIALLPGAGTVGSVTQQNGYDMAGNFTLNAGTASIAGGSLASVTFGSPLDVAPVSVIVDAGFTAGTVGLSTGACSITSKGFVIQGQAPSSGAAYVVSYLVIRSPL